MKEFYYKHSIVVNLSLILSFFAYFIFFAWNSFTWEGEGAINVFPESSAAKNYRLDTSYIEVTNNKQGMLFDRYSYKISGAAWPNGGDLVFSPECTINYPATSAVCDSNSGIYRVEVVTAPEMPENDSGN